MSAAGAGGRNSRFVLLAVAMLAIGLDVGVARFTYGVALPAFARDLQLTLTAAVFDFDGVDPVRVKRQVFPDCRYGGIRSLVGPDGVDRALSASRNAVIGALALVGTIRLVRGPLQLRHIDVLARDVLHRGIGRLLQGQGLVGVGHAFAVHGDRDPAFRRRDGDRMIRSRNPDGLAVHLFNS